MKFRQAAARLMNFLGRAMRARGAPRGTAQWRQAWSEAVLNPDREKVRDLRARLDQLASPHEDLEFEREMLDALEHLVEFAAAVAEDGLPTVGTGHRVVGTDICHFTASVSMPDDPAQPSGRLLLTNARAIFVGGTRGVTVAWHAVAQPVHADRDLILVRNDGTALYRFRCNSFDDALCARFIARQLAGRGSKRDRADASG
jgi:hypothetical protein